LFHLNLGSIDLSCFIFLIVLKLNLDFLNLAIKDKFEGFGQNKKKIREKPYVRKVGKHLNFYVKQSDFTHAIMYKSKHS